MSFLRKQLGASGEDLAEKFLKKKGFKILGRNIRLKVGEIDILAEEGGDLVMVEVKTKTTRSFGKPYEEVDYFKQKKLHQLARALNQQYPHKNLRIDVVSVQIEKEIKVEHLKGAVWF
jgi:putative endonuclease